MPTKLGELLSRQFKKLGIEITDEIKPLLEVDTEVPDELAGKIDKGLLTIEAAKTNLDVLKQLRQNILGPADAKMDDIIKELGITVGDDFVNEKNTYEKLNILSKALFDGGKKKGESNSKQDVSELLKSERKTFGEKEAELQKKLAEITKSLTEKETEFKTTRENDLTSFELKQILGAKDYVFPKEMDNSLKVQTALGAINTELKKNGFNVKLNEARQLVITDKNGEKAYTDKHEPIESVHNFIDGVLTQNKLLKINDPDNQQQQSQGSAGAGGFVTPQGGGPKANTAVMSEIDKQMAELGMGK